MRAALNSISGICTGLDDPEWLRAAAHAAASTPDASVCVEIVQALGFHCGRRVQAELESLGASFASSERWPELNAVVEQLVDQLRNWQHVTAQGWARDIAERAPDAVAGDGLLWTLFGPDRAGREWRSYTRWFLGILERRPQLLREDWVSTMNMACPAHGWRMLATSFAPIAWRLVAAVGELSIHRCFLDGLLFEKVVKRPGSQSVARHPRLILVQPWGADLGRARASLERVITEQRLAGTTAEHKKEDEDARRLRRWERQLLRATAGSLIGELACQEIRSQIARRRARRRRPPRAASRRLV
jgi:hypothetical protein